MPKIRVKDNVHQPLGKDMEELESGLVPQRAVRTKRKDQQAARLKQQAEAFVPQKLSKKILDEARKQQMDIEQEESGGQGAKKVHFNVDLGGDDDSDYEDNVEDTGEDMEGFRMRDGYVDVAYNEDDEAAVRRFMPSEAPQRKTLADLIMEKLEEKVRGRGARDRPWMPLLTCVFLCGPSITVGLTEAKPRRRRRFHGREGGAGGAWNEPEGCHCIPGGWKIPEVLHPWQIAQGV